MIEIRALRHKAFKSYMSLAKGPQIHRSSSICSKTRYSNPFGTLSEESSTKTISPTARAPCCGYQSLPHLPQLRHSPITTKVLFPSWNSSYHQNFSTTTTKMATEFSKVTIKEGNGQQKPKKGQTVVMEYTGWLYDESAEDKRGQQFDSSVGRGDFKTQIGVGRVIQGWDQGVPEMSVGETAILTIPGHMAYGARGFPGLIPANATLLFQVTLKGIQ